MSNTTPNAFGGLEDGQLLLPDKLGPLTPGSPGSAGYPTDPTQLLQLILATLNELSQLIRAGTGQGTGSGGIQATPIPRTIFTNTYDKDPTQSLVVTVPHHYNRLILSAVGGVVNVKLATLPSAPQPPLPTASQFGLNTVFNPSYDYAFGNVAFVGDHSTANNGTQIPNFTGPQEIEFQTQPSGQLAVWSAPVNAQPNSVDLMMSPVEVTGWVIYIP